MTVLYVFQFHSPLSRIGASSLSFITPSGFPVTRGTPKLDPKETKSLQSFDVYTLLGYALCQATEGTKAVSDQTTISGFSSMASMVSLFRFSKFSLYVLYPPFQVSAECCMAAILITLSGVFSSHFLFTK